MKLISLQNQSKITQRHQTQQTIPNNRKIQLQLFNFKESLRKNAFSPSKITLSLDFKLRAINRDLSARKSDLRSQLFDEIPRLQKHGKLIQIDQNQRGLYIAIIRSLFKSLKFFKSEKNEVAEEVTNFLNMLKKSCLYYLDDDNVEYFLFGIYLIKKLFKNWDFDAYWSQMREFQQCVLNLFVSIVKSHQENVSKNSSKKLKCFFKKKPSIYQQSALPFIINRLNFHFQQITDHQGSILILSKNLVGSKDSSKTEYLFRLEFFNTTICYFIGEGQKAYLFIDKNDICEDLQIFISFADAAKPIQKQHKQNQYVSQQYFFFENLQLLAKNRRESYKNIQATRQSSLGATLEPRYKNLQPLSQDFSSTKQWNFQEERQMIVSLTFSHISEQNEHFVSKKEQNWTLPKPDYNYLQNFPITNSFSATTNSVCQKDFFFQDKIFDKKTLQCAAKCSPPRKNYSQNCSPLKSTKSRQKGRKTQRKIGKLPEFLKEKQRKKRINRQKTDQRQVFSFKNSQEKLESILSQKYLPSTGSAQNFQDSKLTYLLEINTQHTSRIKILI